MPRPAQDNVSNHSLFLLMVGCWWFSTGAGLFRTVCAGLMGLGMAAGVHQRPARCRDGLQIFANLRKHGGLTALAVTCQWIRPQKPRMCSAVDRICQ